MSSEPSGSVTLAPGLMTIPQNIWIVIDVFVMKLGDAINVVDYEFFPYD